MVDTKIKKSRILLASGIVAIFLIGIVIGVVYNLQTAENYSVEPPEVEFINEPVTVEPEPFVAPQDTRAKAGTLKWFIKLGDEELSTPAICDLNPPAGGSAGDWEVVVGSAADAVYAVDKNGKLKWTFSDCTIDNAHILAQGLDFDPAPFFSSVTPVDIAGGKGAEILIGEQDGVLALTSEGEKLWGDKGTTDGYYFSSIGVTDLEGDFAGIDHEDNDVGYRDDLEIILGSDNNANSDAFIECWQANGNEVFRYEVDVPFEHAFMTCSIVTTELDGYFQGDEERLKAVRENNPETLYADLLMNTHAYPGRIWKHKNGQAWNEYEEAAALDAGHWGGHESYSTATVGNFTGGPELECIVGHGSGAMSWQTSDGTIRMYRQDGSEVATPYTTGSAPSSVFSSPVACDAQNVDEKDLDEDQYIEYEVFVGCDNGWIYSLSATDLSELWTYQTGGRILSTPGICNINSDDSLEMVIGSNDGLVYCFEADPMEKDLDGEGHPKDDGIEDGGGESGQYDLLWTFDTKAQELDPAPSGEIGISSPVIGDIDRDGMLEILIGDTSGYLYCIAAGGSCVPGQVDWPMFHGDLNKTGFYNPGTSYGVKVERGFQKFDEKLVPEKLQKSAKPGDSVIYNLTIQNIGASKTFMEVDTFWLDVEQTVFKYGEAYEEHEWPAPILSGEEVKWGKEIEGDGKERQYVTLSTMMRTNLTLEVTAPWSGDLSELCRVEVKAHSANDTFARDNVLTETSLEMSLDFELDILKEPVKDKQDELFGQKVIKINPSDQATVEVNLKNNGNLNDTYDLKLEGVLWGWEAWFIDSDNDRYTVGPLDANIMESQFPAQFHGSEVNVKFAIKAPEDAQENEILTLKVKATSQYSGESDYLENITKFDYLIIEVNPIPDLEMKCREPRKYVTAGDNVTFEIEVLNRGNSKIQVKIENSQLEEGWGIYFSDDKLVPYTGGDVLVDVVKEGEAVVLVTLHSPKLAKANSRLNLIIKGVTQGDTALVSTDTVALTAIVSQFFDINVSIIPSTFVPEYPGQEPSILNVDPGSTISYNIEVTNVGNGDDFVIITPTVLEVNWESTFFLGSEERVTSELNLNESVTFIMQIRIPKDQLAGTYTTGINVTSIGDREIKKFDTVINKVFNLSVYGVMHSELTSDKILNDTIQFVPGVSPGSILYYLFEITNGGNDWDQINIKFDPMKPSSSRATASEAEDISLAAWSEFEELDWEAYIIGLQNTEAYLSEVKDMDFGNNVDISHQTAPIGYLNSNTTTREMNLTLGVGQTVWLKVQLIVPRDIPDIDDELHPVADDPWYFRLEAKSTDPDADPNGNYKDVDPDNNEVLIKNIILLPDLEVVGKNINYPSNMEPGKIVTISAEIRNIGDIEAKEVIVTFYVNGKEVRSQTLRELDKDQSRLIPFTWEVASGDNELKIKVDPENAIVEIREDNNEASKKETIEAGGILEIFSNREFCSILPIIIVVIILAFILIIIKKRGDFLGLKPGGGGEI